LSRSVASNLNCSQNSDFTEVSTSRYIGRTRARSMVTEVCAPVLSDQPVTPREDDNQDRSGLLCGFDGLDLSDNGERCDHGENVWRCACSERYGVSISQVCRSGRWVTYHTSPRDCGSCAGRYSAACD
jgi:hypothetical protein